VPATADIVVVGAGIAGASAVETLRRSGFAGRIVLVGDEPELPYERPPLSKDFLLGTTLESRLFLRPLEFFAEHAVELRLGQRAVALDIPARAVVLADGDRLSFERLLIASGAAPLRLNVPGSDLAGIHYLRTLEDARTLTAAIQRAQHSTAGGRAVVVGAGFIGAEVTAACRMLGLNVTLLDVLSLPLVRVLGERMGAVFAELHRAHGVDLRLGEGVAAFHGAARVEEVVTTSGARLPCAFVVVGVGVRPAVGWLAGSGLKLDNGVRVDDYCETSTPGIFAAGDVACWPYRPVEAEAQWVRLEHWDNALRQGAAAARNLLGRREPYAPVPYFWSDQYDRQLHVVGHAPVWEQLVLRGDPLASTFAAFYLAGGRVRAALAVNRPRELVTLKKLVGAAVEPRLLADEESDLRALIPKPGNA
jgi:3-phenylpropionate/trans-cinnamate dioxygenase ferredoxin reductase subunit